MTATRATVQDLRRVNRAAVLRPLFFDGPQNRAGLARRTGLSSASVTNVVGALVEEGLVVEAGTEAPAGGGAGGRAAADRPPRQPRVRRGDRDRRRRDRRPRRGVRPGAARARGRAPG